MANPSEQAIAAAREIKAKMPEFKRRGDRETTMAGGGDPPGLQEFKDGDELVIRLIAEVIDRHIPAQTP